jgi:predicted protein tyrosine phosphatase
MIIISSLWKLDEALSHYNARHVISLNNSNGVPLTIHGVEAADRCNLEFDDVTEKTAWNKPPSSDQIGIIISFGRAVIEAGDPVLIHCTAGVSRSTAAGLLLAASFATMKIDQLVRLLREKAPYSQPNSLMVFLGDEHLSLNGQLISAVNSLGEPSRESTPEPFVLNVV